MTNWIINRTLANAKRTIEREIECLRRITGNDGILSEPPERIINRTD